MASKPAGSQSRYASSVGNQCGKQLHDIQIRHRLAPTTLKILQRIPMAPDRRQVLHAACLATEFRSFPIKQEERGLFREINDHTAIPYTIKEVVTQPWHKVFLLVQIDLLRTGWPNKISAKARKDLYTDRARIYGLLDRVLRLLIDMFGLRNDGRGLVVGLDVLRSIKSGVWEGNGSDLLQIEGIGQAKMDKLKQAGIRTIKQLAALDFCRIERLLSRNPPFGHQMLKQLAGFPALSCEFEVIRQYSAGSEASHPTPAAEEIANKTIWICRVVLEFNNEELPQWKGKPSWLTLVVESRSGRLVWFWRGCVTALDGGKELIIGIEASAGEHMEITFACEEAVGTAIRVSCQIPRR